MPLSIYTRGKNEAGRWRYTRVKEGRGKKTGEFVAPFFIRPMVEGKQIWKPLVAENFADARTEAERLVVGFEAQAKGLMIRRVPMVRPFSTKFMNANGRRTFVRQPGFE